MAKTPPSSRPPSRKPVTSHKRAPGRPAGDSPDLRLDLLDAAVACFVRKGIAATSLRDIASEAHVTPALLHHYFGDKVQLQQAVIDEKLLPIFAAMREPLALAGDDIAALVAGFVSGIGRIVTEHPWLPSLWVREVLCEGGALRDVLFNQIGPQLPQMMAKKFEAAKLRGEINPDLDPRLLMVSLVQAALALNIVAPRAGRIDSLTYKLGDQAPVGAPLAILLVGDAPYARIYVLEPQRANARVGDRVNVFIDGRAQAYAGRIRMIRGEPTFTPYYALIGKDAARLSYLAEVELGKDAADLPAGLPVRVEFDSGRPRDH